MTKKGHILVNLGQFEDETHLRSMYMQNFYSMKVRKQIQKRCFVRLPHATSV